MARKYVRPKLFAWPKEPEEPAPPEEATPPPPTRIIEVHRSGLLHELNQTLNVTFGIVLAVLALLIIPWLLLYGMCASCSQVMKTAADQPGGPASVALAPTVHIAPVEVVSWQWGFDRSHPDVGIITGTALNHTGRAVSYAEIHFKLYDGSGHLLDNVSDNITDWEPDVPWVFKRYFFEKDVRRVEVIPVSYRWGG